MARGDLRRRVKRWTGLDRGANPVGSRLGRRLLAWLLLFSLVPLLGSNMIGYWESEAIIERLTRSSLGALAGAEAQGVGRQLERAMFDLGEIASQGSGLLTRLGKAGPPPSRPAPSGSLWGVAEEFLRREKVEFREFDLLYVQLPDGSLAAASQPLLGNERPPAPVGKAVSPVTLLPAPLGGPPTVRFTVPVRGESGEVVGHLSGLLRPPGLRALFGIPPHLAESIESFIVDEAGRPLFVSHPHWEVDYGSPLPSPLLAMSPGAFDRYRDRNGEEVIGTCVTIPGVAWRYVVEFPVGVALGPLRLLRGVSLGFASIFALMLLVAAWFVAGGIVAPIRRLAAATQEVGGGQLDVRVEATEKDEIGELGRAFNEMTGRLTRTSAQVEELHRREIERAQQLATVGELASGVAHEIKNPVVGISNGLDLVRRRIGEDEELTPILAEMSREISRIEVALRDMLAFARPAPPRLGRADANRIAERASHLVQPAAESAEVELDFCPSPVLPELLVDEELVRQALVNLLLNAIQATPPGGLVRVCTHLEDDEIAFEVSDTGRGISPRELGVIFRPFFTTRHSGSGLGLPISRGIVERHGGRIEVRSREGEGSTFTVLLPVASEDRAPGAGHATHGEGDG
ncbi:MAG: ATP-binding protein [Gemmatimonadota bacterium]